ncbi:MAG: hypothetical protein O7G85_09255 [Planctomycetota bacterium]|nr:hypothetical protein [Planctomycetota bacterium]
MSLPPTSSPDSIPPEIAMARKHWPALAAYAWNQSLTIGRGAVLMHRHDLVNAEASTETLSMSYVPLEYVPKGDDYRALMNQYDPKVELLLILIDEGRDDQLLRLQSQGDSHPTPESCWSRSPLSKPVE